MTSKPTSERKIFSTGKKWSVGCKKHAIPTEVAEIALRYCNGDKKNVSRGIVEMERVIASKDDYATAIMPYLKQIKTLKDSISCKDRYIAELEESIQEQKKEIADMGAIVEEWV